MSDEIITLKTPLDAIQQVPKACRFTPAESFVAMGFPGGVTARIDLDGGIEGCTIIAEMMSRNSMKRAIVLIYTEGQWEIPALTLAGVLTAHGIEVVDTIGVTSTTYSTGGSTQPLPQGLAPTRADLEASYAKTGAVIPLPDEGPYPDISGLDTEAPDPGRLLYALGDPDFRDSLYPLIVAEPKRWAGILTECHRGAPDGQLGSGVAALLALALYLSGDGAGAWCALDSGDGYQTILGKTVALMAQTGTHPVNVAQMLLTALDEEE